jgi:tetratricopeptide (TPR) repeat protein
MLPRLWGERLKFRRGRSFLTETGPAYGSETRMDEQIKQLLLLGREHYAKREYEKAEDLLRQVAKQTDRFADVFDMLGVIAHSKGSFMLARDWFERALILNPNYTEAQLNLMVTLNDLGDTEGRASCTGNCGAAAGRGARSTRSPKAKSPTCTPT